MATKNRVYASSLVEWAKDKPNVLALSGDLTSSCEIDTFMKKYPDRFFNMGIAEQNMHSVAAGLASEGFIPFIHTFAVFIYRRSLDQIMISIGYMNRKVRMVGFLPGILTPGGATHQATEDVAVMRSIPNMTILECGDATDVESVLQLTEEIDGPVYIRMIRATIPVLFKDPMVFGKARKLNEGRDIVLVTSGICTEEAMRATKVLEDKGLSISHFHVTTLKPFHDLELLESIAASKYGAITMENHSIIGGLGTIIAEKMAELGIGKKLYKLGLNDTFAHGATRNYLMKEYCLDAMTLVRKIEEATDRRFGIREADLLAVTIVPKNDHQKSEGL